MGDAANNSIGFATYQLQDNSDRQSNDLASIILFFSVIFIIVASFIFYFWITRWHKVPPQQRRDKELEDQKEIDQLVENFRQQVATVFHLPLLTLAIALWRRHRQPISHEHRRILTYKLYHLLSFAFLVAIVVALAILIGTTTNAASSNDTNTSRILQAALFVFVLSINLYLITRQRCYYKERKELFGSTDAHMHAVYKTRFDDWNARMWSNWVQIAILIIEFFQLLAFPLRDLITVNSFSNDGAGSDEQQRNNQIRFFEFVSIIMNVGGFMPDMRTPTWYTYSLWTVYAVVILGLIIAVFVNGINAWRPYKIPNRWVYWCIPVTVIENMPLHESIITMKTDLLTHRSLSLSLCRLCSISLYS